MSGNLLWLVYRRLRPAIGTSFAFILMYGVLTQTISYSLFFIAVGFMLIHLFGDCYNDYHDIDEDMRNKRQDKLILNEVISPRNFRNLSFVFLISGVALVAFSNTFMLVAASWCALLAFAYSYPEIHLKKYNLLGYLLGSSVWIPTFLILDLQLLGTVSMFGLLFILFSFSQFVFILCQKDTTDRKDNSNLFLSRGWKKSFRITAFFGMLSSLSLLLISLTEEMFIFLWILNFVIKILLLNKIRLNIITRSERSRLVFGEFLTPYLYVGASLFI